MSSVVGTVRNAVNSVSAPALPNVAEAYRDLTLTAEVWAVVATGLNDLGFTVTTETFEATASQLRSRVTVATRGEEKIYLTYVPAALLDVAESDNYAYFGSLLYLLPGTEVRLFSPPLRFEEVDKPYRELISFWHSRSFNVRFVDSQELERATMPGASTNAFASALNVAMPASPAAVVELEPSSERKPRAKMFVSYSHEDDKWLKRLLVNLKQLERANVVDVWSDERLTPGQTWRDEIQHALDSATVAVLLVTPDFIASDFIAEHELPALLASANQGGCLILVVHVSTAFLENVPLDQFQAIPPPDRPLDSMRRPNQNKYLVEIAKTVNRLVHP